MKNKIIIITAILAIAVTSALAVAAASFTDIPGGAYYASAAEKMAERGILSGYGDGLYGGNETVTRAQIATLVCNILGKSDAAKALAGKTAFADVPETHWSTGYVNYAVANGIISGDGDGNFRPDDPVKYEEVVKVIVCVTDLDKNIKIDPSDWSKEYIAAADKAGFLKNLAGKKGEAMKRADIAVIADAAVTLIDARVAQTTVTTVKTAATTATAPAATTVTTPAETTAATTVTTPLKNQNTTPWEEI